MRIETGLGCGSGRTALPIPCPKALQCRLGEHLDIPSLGESGLVAFYFPGKEEVWDTLCGSAFLGNFYDLGPDKLELEAPNQKGKVVSFSNAEAAFQALKFWSRAEEFAGLSGQEAFVKKRALGGYEDWSYAGYGSNWEAMLAVLRQKFKPGSRMAHALQQTANAFLLEHNSVTGRDVLWSDNGNGEGRNWLGLQLMLVRAELSINPSATAWAEQIHLWFGADCIGMPETQQSANCWRQAVRRATASVRAAVEEQRRLEQNIGDWDFAGRTVLVLLVVTVVVFGFLYYLGEARSYEPPHNRLQETTAAPSDWPGRSYEPPHNTLQEPTAAPSDWLGRSYQPASSSLQMESLPPTFAIARQTERSYEPHADSPQTLTSATTPQSDRSYKTPSNSQLKPAHAMDGPDRSYQYRADGLQIPTSTTTCQPDRFHQTADSLETSTGATTRGADGSYKTPSNTQLNPDHATHRPDRSHKTPSNSPRKPTHATYRPDRTHDLHVTNSSGEAHVAIPQGSAAVRTPHDKPDADIAVQPVKADLGGTHAEAKDTASAGGIDSQSVVTGILGTCVIGALFTFMSSAT